jgi:hypothetical protein
MVLLNRNFAALSIAFFLLLMLVLGLWQSTSLPQTPGIIAFNSDINASLNSTNSTPDLYSAHDDYWGNSSIGKCTSVYGAYGHEYDEALQTHVRHNQIHHYPFHVLRQPILDGLWSKEAALLGVLLQELRRDESVRLRWLTWFDADAIIINPLVPLETFLPPANMSHVHALITEDWNGLNNGVFYLRVSAWSVEMLSAVIAYRTFRPEESLPFTEQSAMAAILKDIKFQQNVVVVPPTWFNAYPSEWSFNHVSYHVKQGDMVLHFAGVTQKASVLRDWLLAVAREQTSWERPLADTTLVAQAQSFWENFTNQSEGSMPVVIDTIVGAR